MTEDALTYPHGGPNGSIALVAKAPGHGGALRDPGAPAVAPQAVRVESDALYCSGVHEDGPLAELTGGDAATGATWGRPSP